MLTKHEPKFFDHCPRHCPRMIGLLWLLVGLAAGPVMVLAGLQITIVGMVIIGLVLLSGIFLPVMPRRADLISLLGLMIFCIWGRLSQQWSLAPEETDSLLRKAAFVLVPIWLAIPLVGCIRTGWRHALADGLRWGLVIALMLLVWDISYGQPLQRWAQRLGPNEMPSITIFNRAMVGVAMLSLPVAGLWLKSHWRSFGLFLPLALFALSLRTDCQTATLGLGVAGIVAICAWYAPIWTWRIVMVVFGLGVTMAVPLAWLLGKCDWLIHADWLMLSARHRLEVWGWTASHIHHHLWWGHGLGAAEKFFPLAREMSVLLPADEMMRHKHPHSMILHIWLEAGVFGAVWFLGMVYWLMASARKTLSPFGQYLALVCFAGIMAMMSITSFAMWHSWMICLLGLVIVIVKIADLLPTPKMAQELHTQHQQDNPISGV